MLNCIEEIKKTRQVNEHMRKIITYSFNLRLNEYYCPNCMEIYIGEMPDWCGSCGGHWTNFLTRTNNPIEIEELIEG